VAAGSANTAAATSSAYNAGVAAGSANTAAATGAAYTAGVAAGATAATATAPAGTAPASGTFVMGMGYAALPAGAMQINKSGATYYLSGNTWFKPSYGANGVFYTVVPTP
jgi:hypothetical protein